MRPNGGTREDADAFELRRAGRRVPDYHEVWREGTYDFAYLGGEESGGITCQIPLV